MAHRHAKTGPESREGETLEASGCPDLAKQTKREWPTFEKVFDGPLAETPTHEVCSVHPWGIGWCAIFPCMQPRGTKIG